MGKGESESGCAERGERVRRVCYVDSLEEEVSGGDE